MKLTRLRLQNFRIHTDSVLEFGKSSFVVIRGRNYAGKSSIGQGISMCLTPSTTGLDPRGTGFTSKIKRGATKAVITADIEGRNHTVQRTVTLNTNSTGRSQYTVCLDDPSWGTAGFDKKLDENRAALTVALNTDAFLKMDEKEQKNLLARLTLPSRYDFDEDIVADVEKALGPGVINFEGEPFAAINQAYKKLFEERTIVNRQVKEFYIPEPLPMPAGVDSRALQDRLTTLRMERRERQQERDGAVQEATKVEVERESIKAKQRSLLTDDRLTYLRKVAAGKDELARLGKEKKHTEGVVDSYLKQLGKLEEIPSAGTKCPTCDQMIDGDRLKALLGNLSAGLQEAKDQNFILHQKIKALGDVDAAVKEIAAHEQTRGELVAKECPEPVLFDFQPYDQSLTEIDAEIGELTGQLRPVITAEERQKEIVIRRGQLDGLRQKAALLHMLVGYFDKDGIKAKLLAQYMGAFEAKINGVMSAWGYACGLCIDPYRFDVSNARGDINPVAELSGAERVMFSLAFQCAISRTADLGLVVIDEVAMFLPELRPVLNKRLYEMLKGGYLEQVIMLVADSSEQVPNLANTSFWMVNDGLATKLQHAAT